MEALKAYYQYIPHPLFLSLSQEAANVYNTTLDTFWKIVESEGKWLSKFELQKYISEHNILYRNHLHSDSYLGAMQQLHNNLSTYHEARKVSDDAKPPRKHKQLQPIVLKQSQIKYKDGKLKLTISSNRDYLYINWNNNLPIPQYGNIVWKPGKGWKLSLVLIYDKNVEYNPIKDKILSIDLGIKRIATMYNDDKMQCVTINGKKFMQLDHYRNKIVRETQIKAAKKKERSNRLYKLNKAKRKKLQRLDNISNDLINKTTKFVVDYAETESTDIIVIGNNSGVHQKSIRGRTRKSINDNNRKIHQSPEQKLKNKIKGKFKGITEYISEEYTSQECPICHTLNKTSSRKYKCKKCGLKYDRDGIGSIDIRYKYIYESNDLKRDRILSQDKFLRNRHLSWPYGIRVDTCINTKLHKLLAFKSEKTLCSIA